MNFCGSVDVELEICGRKWLVKRSSVFAVWQVNLKREKKEALNMWQVRVDVAQLGRGFVF